MKNLIAYIPALHKGYMNLFHEIEADILSIIGENLISSIPDLDYVTRKDSIRGIPSDVMKVIIESLNIFKKVEILDLNSLGLLKRKSGDILMPDEDVSRSIAENFLAGRYVKFYSIFLRWNKLNVTKIKNPSCSEIPISDFEKEVISIASEESKKSLDWWRQVGALIVKEKQILLIGHNKHFPTEQAPYIFGDPRSVFTKGVKIELSTSIHAEANLIAKAARLGIPLENSEIFVTDFPCPPCAKLIAESGIKKCFFLKGYAILDGEDVLQKKGVEIIKVNPNF